MNAGDLSRQMIALRNELDAALAEHSEQAHAAALADREARLAKATAYLATSGTVGERQAHVDQSTAELQYKAKLAEDLKVSALEAIRSKRQALSALQSIAGAFREEAALARWSPAEAESA